MNKIKLRAGLAIMLEKIPQKVEELSETEALAFVKVSFPNDSD